MSDYFAREQAHGLDAIRITHPRAAGLIYLHGAHVASWQPAGQGEVLFMSAKSWFENAKPIRGGVPICFPWFGPKADNPAAPAHGTVRLRAWDVETITQDAAGVTVMLVTHSTPADAALFPHPFTLRHRVRFGDALRMELLITNTGPAPAKFEMALHTYFAVADIHQVRIEGLDGVEYLDKVDGGKRQRQSGPIRFTGETDRPYQNTTGTVTIADGPRRITIEKSGSRTTVVWNPWINKAKAMSDFGDEEWPNMVCVETANVGANALELAPGAAHTMAAVIRRA